MSKITCPYCFGQFEHYEVLFRAETVLSEDDFDIDEIEAMDDGPEKNIMLQEYNKAKAFFEREDPDYHRFWEKYNGSTEQTEGFGKSDHVKVRNERRPLIDPFNPNQVRWNNSDGSGPKFDDDGFLSEAEDIYGGKSYSRVCPCPGCHNPLPRDYGKYPAKFISIIGITHSGKTVYLSSLLDNMSSSLKNFDLTPYESPAVDSFIKANKLTLGKPLPQGTPPERLSQPLCYNIQYIHPEKYTRENITIVLYDIAGENCVSDRGLANFGGFIEHSDGLIILEDPDSQFELLSEGNTEGADMVQDVLSNITRLFAGAKYTNMPTAVCISKADKLIKNNVFERSLADALQNPVRCSDNGGFNGEDFNFISSMLRHFYSIHDPKTRNALRTSFNNFNFFAVSALNCSLVNSGEKDVNGNSIMIPEEHPKPLRVEEPLLWLFYQFGFIPSDIDIESPAIVGKLEELNRLIEEKEREKGRTRGLFARREKEKIQQVIDKATADRKELMNKE